MKTPLPHFRGGPWWVLPFVAGPRLRAITLALPWLVIATATTLAAQNSADASSDVHLRAVVKAQAAFDDALKTHAATRAAGATAVKKLDEVEQLKKSIVANTAAIKALLADQKTSAAVKIGDSASVLFGELKDAANAIGQTCKEAVSRLETTSAWPASRKSLEEAGPKLAAAAKGLGELRAKAKTFLDAARYDGVLAKSATLAQDCSSGHESAKSALLDAGESVHLYVEGRKALEGRGPALDIQFSRIAAAMPDGQPKDRLFALAGRAKMELVAITEPRVPEILERRETLQKDVAEAYQQSREPAQGAELLRTRLAAVLKLSSRVEQLLRDATDNVNGAMSSLTNRIARLQTQDKKKAADLKELQERAEKTVARAQTLKDEAQKREGWLKRPNVPAHEAKSLREDLENIRKTSVTNEQQKRDIDTAISKLNKDAKNLSDENGVLAAAAAQAMGADGSQ